MKIINAISIMLVLILSLVLLAGCQKTPTPIAECTADAECVPEQCCHATTCIPSDEKGVCNLACTEECRSETLDCGGYCSCDNGKCTPHYKIEGSEKSCTIDSDCACGTHKDTGECFYGNKAFVNVEEQCPDFCTGIAAMFEIKCVDNECEQVRIKPTPTPEAECTTDADCVPEQCCHPTECTPIENQPNCAAVSCTAECKGGTLDCGGFCSCNNGKCVANTNDL